MKVVNYQPKKNTLAELAHDCFILSFCLMGMNSVDMYCLSTKWKWDRKTVMSFLKSLQDMDVISVKGDVSGITIRVLHLVPDHDIPDRF